MYALSFSGVGATESGEIRGEIVPHLPAGQPAVLTVRVPVEPAQEVIDLDDLDIGSLAEDGSTFTVG